MMRRGFSLRELRALRRHLLCVIAHANQEVLAIGSLIAGVDGSTTVFDDINTARRIVIRGWVRNYPTPQKGEAEDD